MTNEIHMTYSLPTGWDAGPVQINTMTTTSQGGEWVYNLLLLVVLLGTAYLIIYPFPHFVHWLAHKLGWRYWGKDITWRRTDQVLMVGHICKVCGKVTHVHPDRGSYKRMMRGQ